MFWKLLIGFWLTIFATVQVTGVWITLMPDALKPRERFMISQVAPVVLAAAEDAVDRSGPAGFADFRLRLAREQRIRLQLSPAGTEITAPSDNLRRFIARDIVGPDRHKYQIRYWYSAPGGKSGPFFRGPPGILVFGMISGLFFSAILAWYLTKPIYQLRSAFRRLAQGDFSFRLSPVVGKRRDEFVDLARDFDRMALRLDQLVSARVRLLHDVSHELRSPLARLQLAVGLARKSPAKIDASLDRIDRETVRLDDLVGEFLTLARLEHQGEEGDEHFDLYGVLQSVVDDVRFEAESQGIYISLTQDSPPEDVAHSIRGNAEMIRRAIENVVRNAVRFSGRGQAVEVDIAYHPEPPRYRISVNDSGPGIPAGGIDSIFDPFVRGNGPGAGFGLGLAIAKRGIEAHGGSIDAQNRETGGLTINLSVPA